MTTKEEEKAAEPVELSPEEAIAVATAPEPAEATPERGVDAPATAPGTQREQTPAPTEPQPAESAVDVETLLKQLDGAKREVQELKAKVAAANKKKEAAFRKKQEVSKSISEKIGGLVGSKQERNSITGEVQELKKERDRLNRLIREKVQEIKALNERHKDILDRFDRKNNPAALQRMIEDIEYKLETQPMGFDAEQKLTKKLKEFKKQYDSVKGSAEALKEIGEKSKEIDQLKREANRFHRQVQEHAQQSQEKHEALVGESKEVDGLKKREEELYQAFLVEKQKYMEINQLLKEKLADLQRIKESLSKQNVRLKEDQKQEEMKTLQERAKEAEEKVKTKKKLTTEDLLALQGIKK